jgi:hypothetical protein
VDDEQVPSEIAAFIFRLEEYAKQRLQAIYMANSSILKVEEVSSETPGNFHRTTMRPLSEDGGSSPSAL